MNNRILSRLTLVTLLGAALTGASLLNVRADDSSWKDDADDVVNFDPAPVHYPQAAPGSLDLYHWKDYTETSLKNGSVVDARYWRQAKLDKQRKERMKEDKVEEQRLMLHRNKGEEGYPLDMYDMNDPAPMSYPQAMPGGLNLYHWTDYTETSMAPGSIVDARWEQREKIDKERRQADRENRESMKMHRDQNSDMNYWDPCPVSYPQAMPGALNLYHWTDYTQTSMASGSAADAREMNREKMEKIRKEEMKEIKQSSDNSK